MLYKFKSQASAEVIMLPANGDQMLSIIGKEVSPQGIITVEQIPAAIAAIEAAIAAGEAAEKAPAAGEGAEKEEKMSEEDAINLAQRAAPFLALLKESKEGGASVVWGV